MKNLSNKTIERITNLIVRNLTFLTENLTVYIETSLPNVYLHINTKEITHTIKVVHSDDNVILWNRLYDALWAILGKKSLTGFYAKFLNILRSTKNG